MSRVPLQTWSGPERLLALDELIDRCETGQVKHMMQVIEPQFQRDFISLLPKEVWPKPLEACARRSSAAPFTAVCVCLQLALYVLTFLAPRDLLQAAQTCRYWRILAEDNLLWREKCREEGKPPPCTVLLVPARVRCSWRAAAAASASPGVVRLRALDQSDEIHCQHSAEIPTSRPRGSATAQPY